MTASTNDRRLLHLLDVLKAASPPISSAKIADQLASNGEPVGAAEVDALMTLAVATGNLQRYSLVPERIRIADLERAIAALRPARDVFDFRRAVRVMVSAALRDDDLDLAHSLVMEARGMSSGSDPSPVGIACPKCGAARCLSHGFSATDIGHIDPCTCGAAEVVLMLDVDGIEGEEQQTRLLALLEWLASDSARMMADEAGREAETETDRVAEPCVLCEASCASCAKSCGVTEVIQLAAQTREFRCTYCGKLRYERPYPGSDRSVLGECPTCGSATHFRGDQLLDCENGHPESENKFLLAAVLGVKGFACRTCSTTRFRLRQLHDH